MRFVCSDLLHTGFCSAGIRPDMHHDLCTDCLRHEVGQGFQCMGSWVRLSANVAEC